MIEERLCLKSFLIAYNFLLFCTILKKNIYFVPIKKSDSDDMQYLFRLNFNTQINLFILFCEYLKLIINDISSSCK